MEKNLNNKHWLSVAEETHFNILLNNYCREYTQHNLYMGLPAYDIPVRNFMQQAEHRLHLLISFEQEQVEVYAPIRYRSQTLLHSYAFPVFEKDLQTEEVREINVYRFAGLIGKKEKSGYPDMELSTFQERLKNSIDNMAHYLAYLQQLPEDINRPDLPFLAAEQGLWLGHNLHPLTKGRSGFTQEDHHRFAPELGQPFQLAYFLVHPDYVKEQSALEQLPATDLLKTLLERKGYEQLMPLLAKYPDWKVLCCHPWELGYLQNDVLFRQLKEKEHIMELGLQGLPFFATASVRTLYHPDVPWMLKTSLHAKITSAERINHSRDLQRGVNFSDLLKTDWGKSLKMAFPTFSILEDPAYLTVQVDGQEISSLTTALRKNPFDTARANRVSLLASICQDALPGGEARLTQLINQLAGKQQLSTAEAAQRWFKCYVELTLEPVIRLFNDFGLSLEMHQQNMLVKLDEELLPVHIWVRDAQSFLFRKAKQEELIAQWPAFANYKDDFIEDERLWQLFSHHLLVSNLLVLVNAFGRQGLIDERVLIEVLYNEFERIHERYGDDWSHRALHDRKWKVKANLRTALHQVDGGAKPKEVFYADLPNALQLHFFSEQLIHPKGKEIFFSRYFPKEDVLISMRPIDLDNDLEMLHEWFHREHAKATWKMDWPIGELERYYRTLLPGDGLHSYIGLANGEPTFNIEVYWATRDLLGDYYEVLPSDYGTHQFVAPTDPKKKFVSPSTQCMVDYVFAQPEVGKMVGEGAVDSLASMMNKAHVGFKIQKVLEMPHKKANLNFCYRDWYWAKFPQNKGVRIVHELNVSNETEA